MKSILTALALTLSIAAISGPVSAARIGAGTVGPVGPTPYVPGVWRAKVRYLNPTRNPDGTYSTFGYINITADTQAYCDGQLASLLGTPGTAVETACWFDPY